MNNYIFYSDIVSYELGDVFTAETLTGTEAEIRTKTERIERGGGRVISRKRIPSISKICARGA